MFLSVGVICGFAFGTILYPYNIREHDDTLHLIKFPGEMFIRMLKMMIVPVIITSIITGNSMYCLYVIVNYNSKQVYYLNSLLL